MAALTDNEAAGTVEGDRLLGGGCRHFGVAGSVVRTNGSVPSASIILTSTRKPPAITPLGLPRLRLPDTETAFRFTDADIAQLKALMTKTRKADTPHEERRAVAYVIGWMETRTGDVIGTSANRPGMDFSPSRIDPTGLRR